MKRLLATTALALCLGATAAQAAMQKTAGAGYWQALAGTADDSGTPMCEIETHGAAFTFMVKVVHGTLFFHLWRDGWNIPETLDVRVNMWVDRAPGWWVGMSSKNGHNDMLSGEVNPNVLRTGSNQPILYYILDMLRTGSVLRVGFPDGNTPAWELSLEGTSTVMGSFGQCITAEAGQPYGQAAGPGQPYGNRQQLPPTQKSTQPYTPL